MRSVLKNILFSCLLVIEQVNCKNVQVTIEDGTLEGSLLSDYDGGEFYSFQRIPYARPPVGELRFKLPERNEPWTGVLDATREMPLCTQPNNVETKEIGQEDCLYLNVFTKSVVDSALKPVMFYIHGGKFHQGTGGDLRPEFLITEDIVFVTINYRLGVYGFINSVNSDIATDAEMIGNNGFKDQVLAMKWVKNNIQHFGGDPKQVTITGESAGGMSVHGHVLSPLSTGLFQRAIAMSGTTTMVMVPTKNDTAGLIANILGLNTTDYTIMMNELRHAPNADLFQAAKSLKLFEIQLHEPCLTCLVIEKAGKDSFISDYPMKLIRSEKYKKLPIMIGSTNREGLLVYGAGELQENLKELSSHIPFFFNDKEIAMNKVRAFYNITTRTTDSTIDMYTDIWFKYNVYRTALAHSKVQANDNVFYYEFSGDARLNYLKKKLPLVSDFHGACHADELGYLFQCAGIPEKGSLEEKMMRDIVRIWTNFVKTGNPLEKLQPFEVDKYNFVNITNNGLEIGVLQGESFKFWDDMYNIHGNGLY